MTPARQEAERLAGEAQAFQCECGLASFLLEHPGAETHGAQHGASCPVWYRPAVADLLEPLLAGRAKEQALIDAAIKARDLLRQISLQRRKLGALATHAQGMAWEISSALPTPPTKENG